MARSIRLWVLVLQVLLAAPALAQRAGYPADEFTARRKALADGLGRAGIVLVMGKTMPAPVGRFVQDNDFYYLTGNGDLNSAMLMNAATGASALFVPRQDASEQRSDGGNWLLETDAARKRGFDSVQSIDMLPEVMARWREQADRRRSGCGCPNRTR